MVEVRRRPGGGGMAGIALGIGNEVASTLAGSDAAVMATAAGAGHRGVIHAADRLPGVSGMACVAAVVAGDVGGVLAGGASAVVTAGTGAGYTAVIEV